MFSKPSSSFLLGVFLIVVIPMAIAQEERKFTRDFGIDIGWTEYQVREELLTPIRHEGRIPSLGFFHAKSMASARREIHADVIFCPLKSRFEDEAESVGMNFRLNYRYLLRVYGNGSDFNVFVGPIGGLDVHMTYFNMWDESHVYWLNSYYLGLNTRVHYPTSEMSTIFLDVEIPFVALVSRPHERFLYKHLDAKFSWFISHLHKDLTLTSFNRHLALNTHLEYQVRYSSKFGQGLFWRVAFIRDHLRYSKEVNILNHTFGTRLYF